MIERESLAQLNPITTAAEKLIGKMVGFGLSRLGSKIWAEKCGTRIQGTGSRAVYSRFHFYRFLSIPIPSLLIDSRFRLFYRSLQSILLWNRFRNRRIGIGIGRKLIPSNRNPRKLLLGMKPPL